MTSRQTSDDSHTCAAAVLGTEVTGLIIPSNHGNIVTELYGSGVLPNIRRMICVNNA